MKFETYTKLAGYTSLSGIHFACRKFLHTNSNDTPGRHGHLDFYELFVISGGRGVHWLDGRVSEITAGSVQLVKPGHLHEFIEYDNMEIYNLLFTEDVLQMVYSDLILLCGGQLIFDMPSDETAENEITQSGVRIPEQEFQEVVLLLDRMAAQYDSKEPGSRTLQMSEFLLVLYKLCLCCVWSGKTCNTVRHVEQITKILRLIQTSLTEPWSLKKMASNANMSISSFRQEFRKITAMPPMEYLIRQRVKRGAELLHNPLQKLSLSEISWRCGFQDVNYFSRQFKRVYHTSPLQFRKKAFSSLLASEK